MPSKESAPWCCPRNKVTVCTGASLAHARPCSYRPQKWLGLSEEIITFGKLTEVGVTHAQIISLSKASDQGINKSQSLTE